MQAASPKRRPVRWIRTGALALLVAIAIGVLIGETPPRAELGPPAVEVTSPTFRATTLESGPIPGMPRDTFESVVDDEDAQPAETNEELNTKSLL